MRIFLPTAALSFAVLAGGSARAEGTPVPTARLVYTVPARTAEPTSCPDEATLRSTVAARLGYEPFRPDAAKTIHASIRTSQGGLVGAIDVHDPATRATGKRRLSSASGDCAELASAMAFAISVAIDPMRAMRPATEAAVAPPVGSPTDAPRATAPVASREPVSLERATPIAPATDRTTDEPRGAPTPVPVAVRLGAGGSVAVGATPSASFAPNLLVGLGYGRASVDLEGRGHLPSSAEASPTGTVRASLLVASVIPCIRARFALGCVSGGVGRLSASGHGVDLPARAFATYAEVGARLGLELPLTSAIVARITADALVPLTTTTLRLRDAEIASTSPVVAALGAGLVGHVR